MDERMSPSKEELASKRDLIHIISRFAHTKSVIC